MAQAAAMQIYQSQHHNPNHAAQTTYSGNSGADCTMCYGAHHGEYCRRFWERCFECHVPAQAKTDHAEKCNVKNWFQSEKYIDLYVKTPAIRATISFEKPIRYLLCGEFVEAKPEVELFSPMADVHFKFVSQTKIALKTTGFTRIRLPVVVEDIKKTLTERIVFMTSHDRTLVAASSSRSVNLSNILTDFEHNTPLVLVQSGSAKFSVEVYSDGNIHKYDINIDADKKKFAIPDELNVRSNNFTMKLFDANFPYKKMKLQN